jgi:hypothetical protein
VESRPGAFLFHPGDVGLVQDTLRAARCSWRERPGGTLEVPPVFLVPAELPPVLQTFTFVDREIRVAPLEWLRVRTGHHPGRRFSPAEHDVLDRVTLALGGSLRGVNAR